MYYKIRYFFSVILLRLISIIHINFLNEYVIKVIAKFCIKNADLYFYLCFYFGPLATRATGKIILNRLRIK